MLERIKNRDDLLALSDKDCQLLCSEIRDFLVSHIAQTGGHLASNLGVVELTIALHKVYDTSKDRLVFDVGHQSYVHKLLTGRMEKFETLRMFGGIAGFPKPSESVHDAFIAGHASDSVSVALGMARARTLLRQQYDVVAVLGDGALTGGLAFEGLNDAGASKEPFVVVLNDNAMSINPNVGAISKHLSEARLKPSYFEFKKSYRLVTNKLPGGRWFYRVTSSLKKKVRRKLLGVTVFEDMGFHYLGPVDGHDVPKLTYLLQQAKDMGEPVLLHVITKKGKGYTPAEDEPSAYHGIGKFNPDTGACSGTSAACFSSTFGAALCRVAHENPRLCAITAAMEGGTGLSDFALMYPDRFYDVGIAEGHAVSMAAGLAKQGMIPVFAVYSTFLQRSFDMLLHDVSLLGLHVIFAVDRAGMVGEDGETHHGVFDVGFLRQVPGMHILCPASQLELQRMLSEAISMEGPVAVRYPKGSDGRYQNDRWVNRINDSSVMTVVTYGTTINDVLEAADALCYENINIDLIKLDQICPFDHADIEKSVRKTGRLLIIEETADTCCVGHEILSVLTRENIAVTGRVLNLGSGIVPHGDLKSLRALMGLDADGIYRTAKEMLHEK